ncbi:MAG: PilZ domain-containing protein [Candidatus Omnitrophica bacterium]|nr:PilZ domain-containing protein [Candidatus Omnitrophota bacterium]
MGWGPHFNYLMPERRQHARVKTCNLVKEVNHAPSHDRIANLIDLSEGGFQFVSSAWIPSRKIFTAVINLAEKNKQIPVIVKVVWSRMVRRQTVVCRAGVSFLKIADDDRQVIRDYVSYASQFKHLAA